MMKTVRKIFRYSDIFGVPIKILTNENQYLYTSEYGGILSILLIILGLSYFIYVNSLWIGGQLAAKVSLQQQTTAYSEFSWTEPLIQFTLFDKEQSIDPFRKTNNIITPLLFKIIDTSITEPPTAIFSSEENKNSIIISNGSLVLNNVYPVSQDHKIMQQYMLVLSICNAQYLDESSTCADEKEIEQYLNQYHGFLFLTIKLTQLNYVTREFIPIYKQAYQAFSPTESIYSQILLKQQETIIDDGVLFTNFNRYNSINNFDVQNQQVGSQFLSDTAKSLSGNQYQLNSFAGYLIRIDNISIIENVVMPKLGEILAQIGSIVQLIFILKYLAFFLNGQLMESEVLEDIVMMYIPKFKNMFRSRNIIGHVTKIWDDENDYSDQYTAIYQKAKTKCKLTNIIYEISRLQFILESQFGYDTIVNCHQLGQKSSLNWSVAEIGQGSGKIGRPLTNNHIQLAKVHPFDLLIKQSNDQVK